MQPILAGFIPQQPWHLLAVIPPVALWWVTRTWARDRHIIRWHNAVLAVSFWEEILFRGFIYGGIFALASSTIWAVILSSLLFGLFHLRNRWWADQRQLVMMCLYAGLFIGPLLALLRLWTGDIYLAILVHFMNNFIAMYRSRTLPPDDYLAARIVNQTWFERLFSGDWFQSKPTQESHNG